MLLLSGQIFLYIVVRQVPSTSSLIHILRGRLRQALGDTDSIWETWADHYPTLLWILFVGVLGTGAATEHEETQWYISLFKTTIEQVSASFQERPCDHVVVRRILSNTLWEERSCAPVLHVIIFPNPEI